MKSNINNIKQALRLTAKAHRNAECFDWEEDMQFGIKDDHIPILTDISMICQAFYGTDAVVSVEWGITNVYLDACPFLPEVNMELLSSALPYGWVNQIKD